jgi:hypothetical protein
LIPLDQLELLVHNPQALVSIEAQAQLKDMFTAAGSQGAVMFEQVLQMLRQALSSSLSVVFLIGFSILVVAFVVNLFIKEKPLREGHVGLLRNQPKA